MKENAHIHKSTRIGDLLVEQGLISSAQLYEAVELQHERRINNLSDAHAGHLELGEILVELGYVAPDQIKKGLTWQRKLRKTTALMVFIAPLLTAACGGGAANTAPATSKNSSAQSSLSVANETAGDTVKPDETSSSAAAETTPVVSSSSADNTNVDTSSSDSSVTSLSSTASSELSSSSSSDSSSLNNSSETSSSLSSASDGGLGVNGPVQIYWSAPSAREDGEYLDITEIGGYEIRYKLNSDSSYKTVVINDPYADSFFIDNLQGDYVFEIAAFDKQGLYSDFVSINPS